MTPSPKWYMPVAIAGLAWNILGCVAYLSDVTITPEALARMTAAQQAMYASRPAWAVGATALAVWGGALGCIGLILRQRWSHALLLVSLAGVVVQDIALFGVSSAAADAGAAAFVLQGIVLVVALGLVQMSSTAVKRGWVA